jgi:hypothetical protein
MEIKNGAKETKAYKFLIRIMNKLLTIDVPGDWRISKLKKFLENQFQEHTKNSSLTLIYSGKPILSDDKIVDIIKVQVVNFRIKKRMKFIS